MKYILLIALQISAYAMLNFNDIEKKVYKDEPIVKDFIDGEWQCTSDQLNKASKEFMKCDGTLVFRDCYAKTIQQHCTRSILWH